TGVQTCALPIYRGRHVDLHAQHGAGGGDAVDPAVSHDHTGRPGTHEVQGGLVVHHSPRDHRHVQAPDEVLEVQRLVLAAHVLRRDDGPLHHQHVDPG